MCNCSADASGSAVPVIDSPDQAARLGNLPLRRVNKRPSGTCAHDVDGERFGVIHDPPPQCEHTLCVDNGQDEAHTTNQATPDGTKWCVRARLLTNCVESPDSTLAMSRPDHTLTPTTERVACGQVVGPDRHRRVVPELTATSAALHGFSSRAIADAANSARASVRIVPSICAKAIISSFTTKEV